MIFQKPLKFTSTIMPPVLLAMLMSLSCALVSMAQDNGTHKRVLFIFNNDSFTATQIAIDRSAHAAIKGDPNIPIETYSEYVGDTRTGTDYETEFVALLKRKYEKIHFDLIIAVTNSPIRVLLRNRKELFPDTPIILLTLDRLDADPTTRGPNITAVSAAVDFKGTLDIALAQNPAAKRVFFIGGVAEVDKYWTARAQQELKDYESRFEFSNLTGLTIPEMRQALASLPRDTVVFFVTSVRDHDGNIYESPDYLRQVADASTAPIYGTTDAQLGNGIVGGSVASFETLGSEGGQAALRILNGESIENVPPRIIASHPMFDWRQLQRWHIGEAGLPAGSVVQFKPLNAWDQYKWLAFGLLGAITIETMLIGWLIFLRIRRRQAVSENLRLSSEITEIVSNVPGIVWETRTDPVTNERKTTFISNYVQKMLGYSPEEWLEKPNGFGLRLVSDEDREKARQESETVVETGKDGVSEFRWRAKDGSVRWVENYLSPIFNGGSKVVGLRGVALDVTHRKLVEEKARQTEEKDRALLAAIPDLMFLQTDDGVYLDYHAKDPSDLFVPPETFLGKNMRDVLPPDIAEKFAECFAVAENGGEPQIGEYSLDLGHGERWFEARVVRSGQKILSIVRDITDLKRSEREAQELSGRLITAQEDERTRLARELHDGASQNLALLSIELGMIGQRPPADQKSLDAKMNEISARISILSDDLHRMSHELHPAVLRHLGLVSAVREFCSEIESTNKLKVDFVERDVPATVSDETSLNLYRIVQESLRNAVKHSGAANVKVVLEVDGKWLKLAITDDGQGFDAKGDIAKRALGLTSMRERTRMLNGNFCINSEVGRGTEIDAWIPI